MSRFYFELVSAPTSAFQGCPATSRYFCYGRPKTFSQPRFKTCWNQFKMGLIYWKRKACWSYDVLVKKRE
ncbi:hypothetical protein BDN72DRAFT_836553 [Pluteus cervinus]|uniref:Uncharacterized protein n=1 Tax=Pluteus cervinus TaxID=181527 RepID=A0ACD3B2A2_9AGAR|nr:hypothetical protein BDN72DRAFT_836553 [Pluteus cervinus]